MGTEIIMQKNNLFYVSTVLMRSFEKEKFGHIKQLTNKKELQ